MQSDSKAIVRQLYEEVWNKRRLELFDEIISPSHALHDPTLTGAAVGPEAYKRQVTRFVAAFPDLRFTVQDIVGEKEKLAVAWTISALTTANTWEFPPQTRKFPWTESQYITSSMEKLWIPTSVGTLWA